MAFSGEGSGTEDNPYIITNWKELQEMNDYLDNTDIYFQLDNDLNSDTAYYNEYASSSANGGNGWNPIGNSTNPFKGELDGHGHIVSDLYLDRSTTDYCGLMAIISEGSVYDLAVTNVNIVANNDVGVLVGNIGSTCDIKRCFTNGDIEGNEDVGGFVGNTQSPLLDCYSNSVVTGETNVGGFVGYVDDVAVEDCYSTGTISTSSPSSDTNPFCGVVNGSTDNLTNNYANDEITDLSVNPDFATPLTTSEMTDYENDYPKMDGFASHPWETNDWNEDQNGNAGYPALIWERGVTLTINKNGFGSIYPGVGEFNVPYKSEIDLEAIPEGSVSSTYYKEKLLKTLPNFYNKDDGSKFIDWSGDLISINKEETIYMDTNKSVTASFEDVKSNFNMLMEAIGDELEELLFTFQDILDSHFVDDAEGIHLDKIAQMWDINRIPDETDEELRRRIKAYPSTFVGGGTENDIETALNWYLGEGNYGLIEVSDDITITRTEKTEAGIDGTWDNGDSFDFHYKTSNVTSVDSLEKEDGTSVAYTVDYTAGTVTVDEDTGEEYLFVSYTLDVTQYGRFDLYVDPTTEYSIDSERLKYEIKKFKAGGIIVTFKEFSFPDKDGEITVGEGDLIEGHMVNVTEVNSANVVLEE